MHLARRGSLRKKILGLLDLVFGLGLFLAVAVAYTPLTAYMARPLMVPEEVREADAIVVLGGGIDRGHYLKVVTSHRMLKGVQLYFEGRAKKILFCGGTPGKIKVSEAAVMGQEAKRLKIPEEDILLEKKSKRTYEQALEVKKIADSQKWKSILLVTSASHMKRAIITFERAGLRVYPASADPYERYTDDPVERLSLFPKLIHEYGAILYYKMKGWI